MRDNHGRGPVLTVVQGVQLHGGLSCESDETPFFINHLITMKCYDNKRQSEILKHGLPCSVQS